MTDGAHDAPVFAFIPWTTVVEVLRPEISLALRLRDPALFDIEAEGGAWGVTFRMKRRPD